MTQIMPKAESSYMCGVLNPIVIMTHAKLAIAPSTLLQTLLPEDKVCLEKIIPFSPNNHIPLFFR